MTDKNGEKSPFALFVSDELGPGIPKGALRLELVSSDGKVEMTQWVDERTIRDSVFDLLGEHIRKYGGEGRLKGGVMRVAPRSRVPT